MKSTNASDRKADLTIAEFESAFRAWKKEMRRKLKNIDRSHARWEKLRAESRAIHARTRAILDELANWRWKVSPLK